jgi:hypothetical protein
MPLRGRLAGSEDGPPLVVMSISSCHCVWPWSRRVVAVSLASARVFLAYIISRDASILNAVARSVLAVRARACAFFCLKP